MQNFQVWKYETEALEQFKMTQTKFPNFNGNSNFKNEFKTFKRNIVKKNTLLNGLAKN